MVPGDVPPCSPKSQSESIIWFNFSAHFGASTRLPSKPGRLGCGLGVGLMHRTLCLRGGFEDFGLIA